MININNVSITLRCTCTSFVTPRLQLEMNVHGTLAIEKVQCSVWMEAVTTPAYVELWIFPRTLERTVL